MLGHKECIDKLLESSDCKVNVKNLQGWSPLAEAISYGDRSTGTALLSIRHRLHDRTEINRNQTSHRWIDFSG